MDLWAVQSCRACLLQDNASAMYDLAVPDTLKLFNECANMKISVSVTGCVIGFGIFWCHPVFEE